MCFYGICRREWRPTPFCRLCTSFPPQIHEYGDVSEIGAIVDAWIAKQFPNGRRGRGGRADSRDNSRDRSGRNRADKEGGGRAKGGRDVKKEDEAGEKQRESILVSAQAARVCIAEVDAGIGARRVQ